MFLALPFLSFPLCLSLSYLLSLLLFPLHCHRSSYLLSTCITIPCNFAWEQWILNPRPLSRSNILNGCSSSHLRNLCLDRSHSCFITNGFCVVVRTDQTIQLNSNVSVMHSVSISLQIHSPCILSVWCVSRSSLAMYLRFMCDYDIRQSHRRTVIEIAIW